jgi:hypothetical protein
VDALRVVVNRDRQFTLGGFLADDVLIKEVLDFERPGDLVRRGSGGLRFIVVEDRVTDRDAFVADVARGYSLGEEISFPTTSWLL